MFDIVCEPTRSDFGTIYVVVEEIAFPAADWKDSIWFVMEQLLQALVELEGGVGGIICLHEGPYLVYYKRNGKSVELRCVDEARRQELKGSLALEEFQTKVLACVEVALEASRLAGIKADLTPNLVRHLQEIRSRCYPSYQGFEDDPTADGALFYRPGLKICPDSS